MRLLPSFTRSELRSTRHGFTLTDLLAVIAVSALLACLFLPARAGTRAKADAVVCLNNLQRLIRAWQMYADDNHGRLVMNFQGGLAAGGAAAADPHNAPWALGWLDWTTSTDNTNVLFLINDKYAKRASYTDRDPSRFLCPADRFVSTQQVARGWTRRCRSYSANVGIGAGNAEAGPWDRMYQHILSTAGFLFPGPAETWVHLEEHPYSINDPAFFNPSATTWVDTPANYHNGATWLTFADGHPELHKWQGIAAADFHWLSYRGGRTSTNSY